MDLLLPSDFTTPFPWEEDLTEIGLKASMTSIPETLYCLESHETEFEKSTFQDRINGPTKFFDNDEAEDPFFKNSDFLGDQKLVLPDLFIGDMATSSSKSEPKIYVNELRR